MMEHELSRHVPSTLCHTTTEEETEIHMDVKTSEDEKEDSDESPTKKFGTEYTLRQAKLNEELQVSLLLVF